MRHENRLDAGIVCSDLFSVAVVVTEEGEMLMNDMSMQEIAGFLLSGEDVTGDVTETGSDVEIIAVTDATEIPVKRKRGRPSAADGAMTAAERSRRYREKNRPEWQNRRVDLGPTTVARAEVIAAQTGYSINSVIYLALGEVSEAFWVEMRAARLRLEAALAADA